MAKTEGFNPFGYYFEVDSYGIFSSINYENIRYLSDKTNFLNLINDFLNYKEEYENDYLSIDDWIYTNTKFYELLFEIQKHFNIDLQYYDLRSLFRQVYYWLPFLNRHGKHDDLESNYFAELDLYLLDLKNYILVENLKEPAAGIDTTFNLPPFGKISILQGILLLIIGIYVFTVLFGKQRSYAGRKTSPTGIASILKTLKK